MVGTMTAIDGSGDQLTTVKRSPMHSSDGKRERKTSFIK
jgi:hypothetical protein